MPQYDEPLKTVLAKAGGPTALAKILGVVPSAVTQWRQVPAKHVGRIEATIGVDRRVMRPDLFPPGEEAA